MKFLSFIVALLTFATVAGAESMAKFWDFVYEGSDPYADANPLTDPSEYYNPIIPGWHSDPSIVRVDSDYYLVTSSFGYFPGVPIFHSTDLLNWIQIGSVLDRPSQLPGLAGQSLGKGGIYAPHISYNPANKTFYMITTDVGRGHFYVTTSNPSNGWSDPVWLADLEEGIDPSFFFDDNGEAWIVYKHELPAPKWSDFRCIRFIRFDPETGKTFGPSLKLREKGVAPGDRLDRDEGPHIYKINNRYYLLCAEGGTGVNHSAVVYRADSITGEFERWARNPIITQRQLKPTRPNPITCTGHADFVQTPEGDWYAVFLGCRPGPDGTQATGRETFLLPVKWSADSFPYILSCHSVDTVPHIGRIPGATRYEAVPFGSFNFYDMFIGPDLRPEWMSLRGPVPGLSIADGTLFMPYSTVTVAENATPSYVGRTIAHPRFCASIIAFNESDSPSDRAGLMALKDETHNYAIAAASGHIIVTSGTKTGDRLIADIPIDPSCRQVTLRICCDGSTYSMLYQPGSQGPWLTAASGLDASYLSCEKTGGFTGATIGPFALRTH